ncbi:Cell wall / vacuolar inhibitor of fructosidase 2 [Linum perenne]
MNPSQFQFCTILITLISLFHPSTTQATSSKLIQDICNQASKIPPTKLQDCLAAFASDPTAPTADLKGLAQIALKSGETNATEGVKHINSLLAGGSAALSPDQKAALKSCASWFDASRLSFRSSFNELDEDVQTANYDAKIAGDDARNCHETLAKGKVSEDSVEVRVGYLQLYSNVAGVITDRLDV